MRFIGITGGVGAGKSKILTFLENEYGAYVVRADELAATLMTPGHTCYDKLCEAFCEELDHILDERGIFRKDEMVARIFADNDKRARLNSIVHPEVKKAILADVEEKRRSGETDLYILEAALLIEEHYDEVCDELWYVYTDEKTRRERLKRTRGYSDERIDSILKAQLSEKEYRAHCRCVIDNNSDLEHVYEQIRQILSGDKR